MMHGYDWTGQDLASYIVTEKMDGCRAYWTGAELLTKSGRLYASIPARILAALPAGVALDCELWAPELPRRESLRVAVAAALRAVWSDQLQLCAFDLPGHTGPALTRRRALDALGVNSAPWRVAETTAQALIWRDAMLAQGREGLMALDPANTYRSGRRESLLKLK